MTQSVFDMMRNTVFQNSLYVNCEAKTSLANPVYEINRNQAAMAASVAEGGKIDSFCKS